MSSSTSTPTSSNTSLHRPLHDTTTAPVGLDASHATATGSGNASRSPKNTASFTASTEHIAGSLSTGSASSPPPATPSTASPPATRPGVSPITGRLRSSSRSSGSTPTFSKLNKRYNQHGTSYGPHSRSKSSVPAPKVLPFPDLSSRIGTSSRDGSRPTSPTHVHSASHTPPHATPRGSSTDVTLSGMLGLPPGTTLSRRNSSLALSPPRTAGQAGGGSIGMMAGNSWDGRTAGESASRRTSGGATGSPQADSSSPVPAAGRSTPIVFSASRPRAQTGPVSARPNVVSPGPVPILRTETISPPPSPAPQARAARTTPIPIPGGARFALSSTPPPPPIEKDLPEPARGKKAPSINRDAPAQVGSASVAITPAPATQPLADHLYVSFLQGECADVRLWVRRWGVAWKVHKIVLVQAGFFNSLFLGGFSENRHPDVRVASRKGKERAGEIEDDWKGENVELQFDDPNITRAAFEICLSRLYSPHPRLHFPSLLLPTPALPLTPAFPIAPSLSEPLLAARDGLPEHAQLATPRTLLSLLATSIYLGYNPLVREVMAMVLRTVSPCSVGRYLGFAIGDGIGEEEWDGQDDEAAYGLEHVAQVLPERLDSSTVPRKSNRHSHSNTSPRKTSFTHRDSTASDGKHEDDVKVGSAPSQEKLHRAAGSARPSAQNASAEGAHDADASIDPDETIRVDQSLMPHFYGSISNKIGEAAVCWLSRWALDLLHVELAISVNHVEKSEESWRIFAYGGIPSRFIRALLSSDSFFVRSEMERYRVARAILDLRRSGFEADMNGPDQPSDRDAGDVGQSTLLDKVVKEEDEDDSASQREAEMWEAWDEEEGEMMRIFAEGVYYSHMSFEDLSEIARDIDPQTHLPYAPLPVLQAAHWAAADLKARINAHENALADESAVEDQDTSELGLAISTEDLANISARSTRRITSRGRLSSAALSVPGFRTPPRTADAANSSASIASAASAFGLGNPSDHAIYHPIPGDDTFRSGAGGLLFQPTAVTATSPIPGIPGIPDLCGPTNGSGDNEDGGKKRAPPQGENSFFGLSATSKTALQIAARTPDPTYGLSGAPTTLAERWSKTEPFRFSVEFWGVDQLAEKERLYSTTHFHAGSYWNVYVQTIRKKDKGTQLGIYLHRQSKTEGFPPPSCPPVAMQNEVEEAYEGISRSTQAERRREGVLEGYGQASAPAAGTRDRGREGRSMSEGGSDRTVIARRGRSNDYANDRDGLHRYDDQRAVLPRTGSVAANLGAETLSRSLGPAGSSANLATSYGSPSTGLLHQSLRSPNNGEVSASRHRAQPSSISSTSAVLGLGTSSRAAMHRASTSTDMRRTSSSLEDDPQATYRDARRVTKAYFSITCASALGTALIRFSSSPDSFTLSQSWGWKSSALRSEEYLASSSARGLDGGAEAHMVDLQGPDGPDGVKGWHGMLLDPPASIGLEPREIGGSGSLRATVVVGII